MSVDVEIRALLSGPAETAAFGRHLGTLLRAGDWIALIGELGAGKTTLAASVAEGIHPGTKGRSPTYVLVEVYGRNPAIVHADLYRLRAEEEFDTLGIEDLAENAVVVIEWADRAAGRLPLERLDLELRYAGESAREVRIRPRGARWSRIVGEGLLDRERWANAPYSGN